MSTNQPVIDIAVNDDAFNKFLDNFKKFQEEAGDVPDKIDQINSATKALFSVSIHGAEDLISAMGKVTSSVDKMAAKYDAATAGQTKLRHATDRTNDSTKKLFHTTESLARAWHGLTRIGGIASTIAGLATGAGLLGIDALAHRVFSQRRTAAGLGTSIGGMDALKLNYGSSVDADSVMSNVADIKNDQSQWWVLNSLGLGGRQKEDTAQLSEEAITRVRDIWQHGPKTQGYAEARGLTNIMSMNDIRALGNTSDAEFADQKKRYEQDKKNLQIEDQTARQWSDFSKQLKRAGEQIDTSLIKGLTKLTGPLGVLSDDIAKDIDAFVKSGNAQWIIDKLSDGLKWLGAYLGGDQFQSDMKSFADGIKQVAADFRDFTGWYDRHFGTGAASESQTDTKTGMQTYKEGSDQWAIQQGGTPGLTWKEAGRRDLAALGFHQEGIDKYGRTKESHFYNLEDQMKTWHDSAQVLPQKDIEAEEVNYAKATNVPVDFAKEIFKIEGGTNPDGSNRISPTGAIGPGQLEPDTAKDNDANPYDSKSNVDGSIRYMAMLLKRYNGDQKKAAAAYNGGMGNVDNAIAWGKKNHQDWFNDTKDLQPETLKYADHFKGGDDSQVVALLRRIADYMSRPNNPTLKVTNDTAARVEMSANAAAVNR